MKVTQNRDQIFTFQLITSDSELYVDLFEMILRWIPRKLAVSLHNKVDQESLANAILIDVLYGSPLYRLLRGILSPFAI
ncbi:MAG: hypothetical protein NTY15_01730 [Planctomycetota bacterium]|nr:hypothetical protein [Planctomycetota bacterium]